MANLEEMGDISIVRASAGFHSYVSDSAEKLRERGRRR